MQPLYSVRKVRDWDALTRVMGHRGAGTALVDLPKPLLASIAFLRDRAKATHVVIERRYIDRDHRSAFSHFYSRQFHSTSNVCARYHFFSVDQLRGKGNLDALIAHGSYLGYIIQRPSPESPVGRSVLAVEGFIPGACVCSAGKFEPHLDVYRPSVVGVPFAQQDSVVMRCAETAIWTAARIMHKHFDHPLILPGDITSPVTIGFSSHGRLIPSAGLSTDQMAHALTMLDLGPIVYDKNSSTAPWDPLQLVTPYLASSIPVILGVPGHAVTACGLVKRGARHAMNRAPLRSVAEWVGGLVIQDDALGPYRLMPRNRAYYRRFEKSGLGDLLSHASHEMSASKRWWLTVDDVDGVIIPLPERIYQTAHDADLLTRNLLDPEKGFIRECEGMIRTLARHGCQGARTLIESALGRTDAGGLVYSLRCRSQADARQAMAGGHPRVRDLFRNTPLPRRLWVAEFTSFDLFTQSDPSRRKLLGELYFDATAPVTSESSLIFAHCMGVVLLRPDLCVGDPRRDGPHGIVDDFPFSRPGIPLWSDRSDG